MNQESTREFYENKVDLESLSQRLVDMGLTNMVDEVYTFAEHMKVGERHEFDVPHLQKTLRLELTMDGFIFTPL